MLNHSLLILIFLNTITFSQNPWGGLSVSTPDNLDAISINPAGLGLSRGNQNGFYIPFDTVFTIHSSNRNEGFGYDLTYQFIDGKMPDYFNPYDGNIAFGSQLYNNTYAGIKWNKHKFLDFGLLYRPLNQISIGATIQFDDKFNNYKHSNIGFAMRPFLKHYLTIGVDIKNVNGVDSIYIYPHIAIEPIDGISIIAQSNIEFSDYKLNIGFNFGKNRIYSPSYINKQNEYSGGIGFYTDTQIKKTILKKQSKDKKKYVRMKLNGLFIEEKPVEPPFTFNIDFNLFGNNQTKGTQLRTWIDKLDKLTNDENIDGLIIDMGSIRAGFAKRGEIYSALKRFKEAGKEILVYASMGISNADYYLISMANEIYLNEFTGIDLKGISIEINFFRGLLDTLLIVPEVFRVEFNGKSYKTAGDQLLNKKMSNEMKENYSDLLNDFYAVFISGISDGRGWDKNQTQRIIDNGPYFKPQDAIVAGLADSIMYPDQFNNYIDNLNNKKVDIIKWDNIKNEEYYVNEWKETEKHKIAIIYAVGGIISGKSNPGPGGSSNMGDKTIIKAIKKAREDDEIKAILLRIDSGGGSALASDQMWREILKTTDPEKAYIKKDVQKVKPLIASMSDVAASGGYYIACQADTIIAHPSTVTGSIGVIGVRLNFSKLLNKWGISSDLIKKGDFADLGTGNRLVTKNEKDKIQGSINDTYSKFKERVIYGRKLNSEATNLDDVAMGRVFTGKRAKNDISIPLVDINGGLHDAIEITKAAAGLENMDIEIVEYPQPEDKFKEIAKSFSSQSNINYKDHLPEYIASELEFLDVIPILIDSEIQMIMPYKITVK